MKRGNCLSLQKEKTRAMKTHCEKINLPVEKIDDEYVLSVSNGKPFDVNEGANLAIKVKEAEDPSMSIVTFNMKDALIAAKDANDSTEVICMLGDENQNQICQNQIESQSVVIMQDTKENQAKIEDLTLHLQKEMQCSVIVKMEQSKEVAPKEIEERVI